jgi:hypothetical protein
MSARKTSTRKGSGETLPQSEIVAIAAYLAGAERKRIDTEDIAFKAHEIAPGRFCWRKYKDQIDLELIYKHLWDLTQPDKGKYVTGSKNEGWMLTVAGTAFAQNAVDRVKYLAPAREKLPRREEHWLKRERVRMLSEVACAKVREGRNGDVTIADAERFFRLDDYVLGAARERKIQQAVNAFHNDPDLGPVILVASELARSKK